MTGSDRAGPWIYLVWDEEHLRGIYLTREEAVAALHALPANEDHDQQVEEWPLGRVVHRGTVTVEAHR